MKKTSVFGILCLFIVIVGCSEKPPTEDQTDSGAFRGDNQLTLAIGGEPTDGFDPAAGWGRYGSPLFQSTLLRYDANMEIIYDLATSYEVTDDGREWKVTIRDDAIFSDGEPLTADDVVFTFETAKQAQSIVDLSNLDSVEKISETEITFQLKKPQSIFIHTLRTLGIVPQHAYGPDYAENPVGSGPYQFVEWRKGEQLMVKKNPHYFGKTPEYDQLTFLFMEEDQALAAAKRGDIDVLSVPITMADQEIDGMERLSFPSVDNRGVMLPYPEPGTNSEGKEMGHPVTSDIAIRKALNYATDRQAMVEGILESEGTVAFSPVDGLPWKNEEVQIEDNDHEQAEQILTDAGWSRAEDNVFEKNGQRASFTLYYPSGDQMRQSLSLVFADQMNEFGFEISTEGASWNDLEQVMHKEPVMMGWGSHNPLELYSLYHSSMSGIDFYNANYYENETVDYYLDQAMEAETEEEAITHWQAAQWDGETGMSVLGDASWVWLVNLNHIYYVDENIEIGEQKVQPHGHGWPITDFITEWD